MKIAVRQENTCPKGICPMTSVHLFLTARATNPDAWLAEKVRRKKELPRNKNETEQ